MEGTAISGKRGLSSRNRTMYSRKTYSLMSRIGFANRTIRPLAALKRTCRKFHLLALFLMLFLVLPASSLLLPKRCLPVTLAPEMIAEQVEVPTLVLSSYSRSNSTRVSVTSGIRIAGDHVILNATWTPKKSVNRTGIVVNATAIPSVINATSQSNSVEIDTRTLGNNATCRVTVTTQLVNGTQLSQVFTNVFLGNFFVPHVKVLTPNGGEKWDGQHNITWIGWDKNSDDVLTYEVLLSPDDGETFQLLASELSVDWLQWDFSGFLNMSTYIIMVRVSDGIYQTSDTSDTSFTAGTVNPTSKTSTTPTTSSLPGFPGDLQLALFIAAAIIIGALFSVVVYYQAKHLA
jgi:hypothetical protein